MSRTSVWKNFSILSMTAAVPAAEPCYQSLQRSAADLPSLPLLRSQLRLAKGFDRVALHAKTQSKK